MITILDYAEISGHIYDTTWSSYGRAYFNKVTIKDDISSNETWYLMTDVDPYMNHNNHFYAALYMKFKNKKATDAVIAVRGTVFTDKTNLGVDALSWYADALGEGSHDSAPLIFTNLLISFVFKAYAYIRKHFPYISHLKFTGHSLGGALAQLMPLSAGFPGEAVVFNSPGVGHIPGVNLKNAGWVTLVNARYGFINKIGLPVKDPIIIDVPDLESEAKALFEKADSKDFDKSVQLYKTGDYVANIQNQSRLMKLLMLGTSINIDESALFLRLKSYMYSFNQLGQMPEDGKSIQNICYTPHQHFWNIAKAQLATLVCTNEYKIVKLNDIIDAQHSILNMVKALQNKVYASIAYQYA